MSFSYFDRVYCIHLPNVERRARMAVECAKVGIAPVYVHAAKPARDFNMTNMRRAPAAEFGANLSHIRAVVQAIADGAENALFLEDDIEFCPDASRRLGRALDELPPWDVLYMGGHPREPVKPVGRWLMRVKTFSFAESYALNRDSLRRFFEFWTDSIGQPNAMYDLILGRFAAENRGYCVYPLLTSQPPGWSHIGGKHDDKTGLVERGWRANSYIR